MTPHSEASSDDAAVQADRHLRAAATILRAPQVRTVYLTEIADAIEHLCRAALATPGFPNLDDRFRNAFRELLAGMADDLLDRVGHKISWPAISLGMSAASGLLADRDTTLNWDRNLHARRFAAELRALAYRQEINARGDPLLRSFMIRDAVAAMPQPDRHLH
ncbi:hypothetical protein [Aquibium microcysteis]|uniref:hypothetical protein n=1 Tax=Aquibium microcysteis TaxID=675281 RepID=UPI00165D17D8|nr:hypothetical protein [Aquibium microcysteis]